jgi:hypothetical protein
MLVKDLSTQGMKETVQNRTGVTARWLVSSSLNSSRVARVNKCDEVSSSFAPPPEYLKIKKKRIGKKLKIGKQITHQIN